MVLLVQVIVMKEAVMFYAVAYLLFVIFMAIHTTILWCDEVSSKYPMLMLISLKCSGIR